LGPRLVAAAAIAALKSLETPEDAKAGAAAHGVVDEAFAFLQGGIAALQERRGAEVMTAPR
jgi:hypothetical protein